MPNPHLRAPHAELGAAAHPGAPNAALLIDFDNVTMGMRSDLAKELKNLLDSDIIKGKVTVQRAYADWRRYPQYIVPLSEASIDLIFAPAYGSSKKNATDIRMAIDGMELVFIRPEIGTFILLTGDSDFSSLVLKLKEYGKYVIGIGIQESSSDILVQNCDEYYSYTALTGLRMAGDERGGGADAWQCVEDSVKRMASRGDVMRSDRLKQVMLEQSPTFDERSLGFKSFSKFLFEAANRGRVVIRRGENGQYHVAPAGGAPKGGARNGDAARSRGRRGQASRRASPERPARESVKAPATVASAADSPGATDGAGTATARETGPRPDRARALELISRAVRELSGSDRRVARDSDVKRRMLAIDRSFNEGALGFGKFSKFLLFAADEKAIRIERDKSGNFAVLLSPAPQPDDKPGAPATAAKTETRARAGTGTKAKAAPTADSSGSEDAAEARRAGRAQKEKGGGIFGLRLWGSRKKQQASEARRTEEGSDATRAPARKAASPAARAKSTPAPKASSQQAQATESRAQTSAPQAQAPAPKAGSGASRPQASSPGAQAPARKPQPSAPKPQAPARKPQPSAPKSRTPASKPGAQAQARTPARKPKAQTPKAGSAASSAPAAFDARSLGLPTSASAIKGYLANRYKGVGVKTAERLVESFGPEVFRVLQNEPERVRSKLQAARAASVLAAWATDYERRTAPRADA